MLSLALAYFSWKFVESPFKRIDFLTRGKIFSFALIGTFGFIYFGMLGQITNGKFLNHSDSSLNEIFDLRFNVNHGLSIDCEGNYNTSPNCSTSSEPEILLRGDSYAMHLAQGLIASNPEIKLIQKTISVCGPFFDIAPINAKHVYSWSGKCISNNDKVFEYLKNTTSIKYVVLSSPFGQFVSDDATVLTKDGRVLKGKDYAFQYMLDTIAKLRELGKIPIVFSPLPQNGQNIGNCLKKALFFEEDILLCDISYSNSLVLQANVWSFLKELKKYVTVVNLTDYLCNKNTCTTSSNGIFIYRDGGHLSHEGSAYIGKKFNFCEKIIKGK